MGVKDRSFWRGVNRSFGPSMNDVMESELAKKLFKQNAQLKNVMQQEEDRSESTSLQQSIIGDQELTPEERTLFASQFGDGTKPLSKEARARLQGNFDAFKKNKKTTGDKTAEEAKALEKEKATAKASFEAQKRRIPKDATDLQAAYGTITEPSAADVEALRDDIKLYHDRKNKPDNKPNETETKIGLVKKATEIGGGDPYKGWQIIKDQDPTTFYEAQQRGIKTEREDKVSPKAEKLLEDVQGEWQYEKDQYAAALKTAAKAIQEKKVSGDKTLEEIVAEQGINDPGPISMYAFKYLSDRKDFLNEDAMSEAFHMLNRTAGTDKSGRGMLKAPDPTAPQAGPSASPQGPSGAGAPTGATGAGTVSAGQEAGLENKLSRADAILQALEEELKLKK